MKKLLRDMSKDTRATNGAYHDYERIELSHFYLAISLLDVRRTVDKDTFKGSREDFG